MIRIIGKQDFFTDDPESLPGKYVFKGASLLWDSVGSPMLVHSVSGKSLHGARYDARFSPKVRDGIGGYIVPERSRFALADSEPPYICKIRSVRAICDTPDEVLEILNFCYDSSQRFTAFLKQLNKDFHALDGTGVLQPGVGPRKP